MVVLRLFANITFLSLVFLWTFQVANAEQDRLPLESSYSEAIASVAALPSPTHHWTFDEGIGTIAADTGTTGGVNGALLNGASWTAGVDGDALLLGATDATSTDDYVDLGTGVPLSTSMTIAMWVRLDVNSTTDSAMILDGPVSDRLSLDAERNADGDVVTIGYGPNGFDTTTSVLPLGEWTHLVLARQGANLDFYVNGTLEDTFSFPASVGRQFASIGDDDDGTITSIIGAIDDVIVYDGTKLDATQVQELYDSYSIDSIPEPNHHWTFDENGGNIANDTGTDTALPGTLTGSATWTTGVSGEAVLLTASDGPGIGNDAVDISGTDTANAPWTLSMWLRRDEASLSADVRIIDGTFTDILSEIDGTDNTGIHRLLASNGDFGYQFPIGEWIHFVWVADDSQIVGYANGVAVGTIGFSVAQEIRSFGNSGLGSDSSFIGAIDDVRRYDEDAFTAAQVQELYDSYGQGIHHDYGDLPDVDSSSGSAVTSPNYNTNSTGTVGASHIITPGLYLGAVVDDELEGQPSADSTADDVNGTINDEDGVSFSPLTAGETATITATVFNTTALDAILYAFIDWNGDGGFVGFEETISTTVPSGSFTTVVFDVDVPANADTSQQLGARFRLSSDVGLGPDGPASDGEVEDYLVSVAPPPLSIGDFVWDDLNQNGIQDGNEPGIDGVTVKLYNVAGSLIDSTSTAFDGSYSFTNLADGFYYVQVDVPTGYGITTPDLGGDDALDSDLDGLARTITFQILPGTGNNNTWDAGLFSTGPTKATVKGYVFDDADGDAFFDLIEVGIVGVSIDLIDASSPNNWTTVTTVDGSYIFTDVTPGIYTVQEIDPIGYASTTDNLVIITATAGTTTTVDFGDLFLADLVINEIDYNQPGADSADLIELRNNETISITLDNHVVQFINGTGPADYANIDLSGHVIEPGSYLVLCSDNTAVANCDIEFSASLQNGPDAVALLYHGVIVDTVSYDGDVPGYTEGTSTQPDPDTEFTGLSRLPDGTDTDDNNSDFAPACITPGEANTTQNTNCGPPDVMLAVSPLVTEGEQIVITATLDITSSQDITVSLHFTDIATTAGVDYAATAPAEIIVPAGSISAWILFDAVDDSDVEGDESFEVTIGAVDGAIDISTPQTVTIIDNDQPTVDLSVNPDVLEGDMGTITATLDVSATWDITVTLAFTDDTATSGGIDYTEPAPAEIVIPAGDLSASISFTTIDDVIVEGDETFDVSIVDAVSAIDFSSPQTVTILDNDQPTVDLTVSSSVTEGQSIEVRTTLDVTYTDNVTVTIVFTDNTAIDGIDYLVGGAVSVVIPAGANGIGFFINTVDDVNIEGDETFEVGIFQSIGATYSTASQTVTIIDNDEPNVDLVTSPDVQEGSTGAITATLDVSVTWDVTVTLAFTDSTAISGGIDYTEPTPAEIVIPAGDVSA
ncbi:MAG: SdrD B-like domain-containing protein, partial [Chloroflexota bacterium]